MHTVRWGTTGIVSTVLGFGCAGLYQIPDRSDRQALLGYAFDAGLRHFDVAPMYGLGLAEAELSNLLRQNREDVTVTTKFGIDLTRFGRTLGRTQAPLRTLLSHMPRIGGQARVAAAGPRSGPAGRLLYSSTPYTARQAEASLFRSLRALGTTYIDFFALHDPSGLLVTEGSELADFLDLQISLGRIRSWGIAADVIQPHPAVLELARRAQMIQRRVDIFDVSRPSPATGEASAGDISFGCLRRPLPLLKLFFAEPDNRRMWNERLGCDTGETGNLVQLLIRDAIRRNSTGPVIFTSTQRANVSVAAKADIPELSHTTRQRSQMDQLVMAVQRRFPEVVAQL